MYKNGPGVIWTHINQLQSAAVDYNQTSFQLNNRPKTLLSVKQFSYISYILVSTEWQALLKLSYENVYKDVITYVGM